MTRTWKITKTKLDELRFDDNSSLDAVTRQLPDGYYSTFRTFDSCTRVIGLSAHLKRLPHADASFLRGCLAQLLQPFRPPFGLGARRGETADEARVRVMETKRGGFYISIEPLKLLPREIYEKGVRVETTTLHRNDPRVKSTAFISASDGERKHIAQEGIFEALLVKNGRILEGMTSNFFYIFRPERNEERLLRRVQSKDASTTGLTSISPSAQRGIIYTAQRDILLGVTRTIVIRAARGRRLGVRFRSLRLDQLSLVKEAFITSSSRGIVPVIQIDDVRVGQGSPGKVTRMLSRAYEEYVLKHAEKIS
ncbi:MAG: hypothetical protein CNIPEHKO_00909 [Anaerolineales bacterium]|nr:hypothetical protein [Anaerolineales bacterium]